MASRSRLAFALVSVFASQTVVAAAAVAAAGSTCAVSVSSFSRLPTALCWKMQFECCGCKRTRQLCVLPSVRARWHSVACPGLRRTVLGVLPSSQSLDPPPPPCALPAGGVCCCHLSPASPVTEHGKAPKAPVTGCTCTAVPTGQSPLAQGCLLSLPRIGWSTALHSLRKPCTVCSCQGHICLFSVLHH